MLYNFFTIFLPSSLDKFKGCQWVQMALPLSPTANTVTTATQIHLELQENHPKQIWSSLRPLPPSKLVRSLFFFGLWPDTPPLTIGLGSSFRHPLEKYINWWHLFPKQNGLLPQRHAWSLITVIHFFHIALWAAQSIGEWWILKILMEALMRAPQNDRRLLETQI